MKNLTDIYNESILDDMDISIQKNDNIFKQAQAELNYLKNITWEDILNTLNFDDAKVWCWCTFQINCPNVLALFGIDHPDADGLIIYFGLDKWYCMNTMLTIKHKNQRNYTIKKISKSWVDLNYYTGPIRPRRLSTAISRMLYLLHELADIKTLITINSNDKIYN